MKFVLSLLLFSLAVMEAGADSCCSDPLAPGAAKALLPDASVYHLEGSWTRQDGQERTLDKLRGKPCLVTMFFASCSYACPMLIEDLRHILKDLPDEHSKDLQVVLLSFDSDRDLPPALAEFAKLRELPMPPWTLMHTSEDIVREAAAVLGVRYRKNAEGNFAHSNIITLLNPQGEIVYQLNGLRADSAPLLNAIETLSKPLEKKN